MKIVGKHKIKTFSLDHADARSQLSAWLYEIEDANWRMPTHVKSRYPSASFIGNNRIVFNIKGNKYRIDTKISFKSKTVLIKRIGTHADYSKWKF